LFVRAGGSDQPVEEPGSDDPARGVRRLLVVLLVLAIAAGGGAFALSQRGESSPASPQPRLFVGEFFQKGFMSRPATLVSSYAADAAARTARGTVKTRGTVYVVARCQVGTVRVVLAGLSSSQPCTGHPVGLVALNITQPGELTAPVTTSQSARWGVAIYR
jgi:hypothetical protein